MHYLAIDPGQTNTGWASFNEVGEVIALGVIKDQDAFLDWMEQQTPKVVICETYKIKPGVKHNFSQVPTLQLIGAIKRVVKKLDAELVMQDNTALPVGLRHLGLWPIYQQQPGQPKKHVPDEVSALAHGEYYLVKNKIKKHRLDESNDLDNSVD